MQIEARCDAFGSCAAVKNTAVYGGVPKGPQGTACAGVEIVIATPGGCRTSWTAAPPACGGRPRPRRGRPHLDLGFEPQLRAIVERARADRQTLMWSATWREVERLARAFLRERHVRVNDPRLASPTPSSSASRSRSTHGRSTPFLQLVRGGGGGGGLLRAGEKAIVFCETKRGCDALVRALEGAAVGAEAIHGDKSQQERDWVLGSSAPARCR